MQLKDTVALVTGAASGLGAATAAELVAQGATVCGVDLQPSIDKAEAQDGVHLIAADVTDPEAVQAAVAEAAAAGPLRLAVNCAGIAPGQRILSKKGPHDIGLFQKVVEINLIGTFSVMTAAAAAMAELEPVDDDGQRGLIVSTASVAAFEGQIGQAAYAASKGGVVALTKSLARAGGGLAAFGVAPGFTRTDMAAPYIEAHGEAAAARGIALDRLTEPDDVAPSVVFLASGLADHATGTTVDVNAASYVR